MLNEQYKKLVTLLLTVGMIISLTACGRVKQENSSTIGKTADVVETEQTDEIQNSLYREVKQTEIKLAFDDTTMTAVLDDSETSRAFIEMLPLTLTMNRYADREYYAAIDELPQSGEVIEDFENGDVTYYTNGKSLAIFFGNADTSSQSGLIRMGCITTELGLFDMVGESSEVTISLLKDEADMKKYDLSGFENVQITGIDLSELTLEEQSVLYQQARYCQAMTDADIQTMAEITADDMIFTHMSGRQQTRDEYFNDISEGNLRYYTIGIENPEININGDYASVSYTSVLNANAYGARGTYHIDGVHWYKKIGNTWIACNGPQ